MALKIKFLNNKLNKKRQSSRSFYFYFFLFKKNKFKMTLLQSDHHDHA